MIRVGSVFSGIGGFELGIEAAFGENVKTVWQVEKDPFCQKVLKKHWPNALLLDDVKKVNKDTVEPIDMLIGGFPCQSISVMGKGEGLENEEKSGLWWEMYRIIGDLKPRIVVLENVKNIIRVGGTAVVGALAKIGYSCEWEIVSARSQGACHLRERWFCVAYSNSIGLQTIENTQKQNRKSKKGLVSRSTRSDLCQDVSNTTGQDAFTLSKHQKRLETMGKTQKWEHVGCTSLSSIEHNKGRSTWPGCTVEPILLGMDDGVSDWMDRNTKREHNKRIKALGNAIVPACSEYVGRCILNSGLVDDLLEGEE